MMTEPRPAKLRLWIFFAVSLAVLSALYARGFLGIQSDALHYYEIYQKTPGFQARG